VRDLTSALQGLADEAAGQARPLPPGEVLRQGDRRRRQAIARRSAAGVAAAGLIAAGIASAHLGAHSPPAATSARSLVKTGQVTTAAGTLAVTVIYQPASGGHLRIVSVTFAGRCSRPVRAPLVEVAFGPDPAGHSKLGLASFGVPVTLTARRGLRGALSARDVKTLTASKVADSEPVSATLSSRVSGTGQPVLAATTTLTP
jgi:hypothetical protein